MGRTFEFDGIRGIAAILIMLAHIGILSGTPWVTSIVDLFFVISGFLITANILKNSQTPRFLSVFFVRRALRIWPAYYVALVVCLVLNRSLKWDFRPDAWPQYLTFTQNAQAYMKWPLPQFSGMFQHTWTLAIEEQFYLLWPLLMFRAGRRGMYAITLTFALLPPIARSFGYWPYLLLTRSDGLALGSLLSLLLRDGARVERRLISYRVGFAIVGLFALFSPIFRASVGSTQVGEALFTSRASLTYFGLVGLVFCSRGHPWLALLRGKILCYMGTISYGLYLYHPLVFASLPALYKRYIMRKLGLNSTLLMDLVMLGICVVVAEASRRWLEGPVLKLKDRWSFKGADKGSIYRGPHLHSAPQGLSSTVPRATEAD